MNPFSQEIINQMGTLLNIGIALSAEKDHNKLLEMILTEARKVTNADAGTLYLREGNHLVFKIIQNETLQIFQGGDGEPIDLPHVPLLETNVAAYVAMRKERVNIADVYETGEFDFSGPKKYDTLTGYHTVSMLVIPMESQQGHLIGVLQLINARNGIGEVIPFAPYFEKVVTSLASQAAIALANMQFLQEIEKLLHSFVEVMATTIDARSPYNANHTRRVARMTEALIKVINGVEEGPLAGVHFTEEQAAELVMAAWLHDIGKIATPSRVMDKASRLAERLELVLQRMDLIAAQYRIRFLEKRMEAEDANGIQCLEDEYETTIEQLQKARDLILIANHPMTVVNSEMVAELMQIGRMTYQDGWGNQRPWLTGDELKALSVARGTLTQMERKIMEEHVELTRKILALIPFPEHLQNVPKWAILHHEYLDGSGYPKGLLSDGIPLEGRILTLIDIFDALIAADRPYKRAISVDKSLQILEGMMRDGKLDPEVFRLFREARIWESLQS